MIESLRTYFNRLRTSDPQFWKETVDRVLGRATRCIVRPSSLLCWIADLLVSQAVSGGTDPVMKILKTLNALAQGMAGFVERHTPAVPLPQEDWWTLYVKPVYYGFITEFERYDIRFPAWT